MAFSTRWLPPGPLQKRQRRQSSSCASIGSQRSSRHSFAVKIAHQVIRCPWARWTFGRSASVTGKERGGGRRREKEGGERVKAGNASHARMLASHARMQMANRQTLGHLPASLAASDSAPRESTCRARDLAQSNRHLRADQRLRPCTQPRRHTGTQKPEEISSLVTIWMHERGCFHDIAEPGNLTGEVNKRGCYYDLKGFDLRFPRLLSARFQALQEAGLVLVLPALASLSQTFLAPYAK